jgi:hypothetical protein
MSWHIGVPTAPKMSLLDAVQKATDEYDYDLLIDQASVEQMKIQVQAVVKALPPILESFGYVPDTAAMGVSMGGHAEPCYPARSGWANSTVNLSMWVYPPEQVPVTQEVLP